jgi:hypothetical protein
MEQLETFVVESPDAVGAKTDMVGLARGVGKKNMPAYCLPVISESF